MVVHYEGFEFALEEGRDSQKLSVRYRKRGESVWRDEMLWIAEDCTLSEVRTVFGHWVKRIETIGAVK